MLSRPDFIITGGQVDGMFMLVASRSVREISATSNTEFEDVYDLLHGFVRGLPRRRRMSISAEVTDFVTVIADSYAEAWETLFKMWSPPGQPELPGRRAIE